LTRAAVAPAASFAPSRITKGPKCCSALRVATAFVNGFHDGGGDVIAKAVGIGFKKVRRTNWPYYEKFGLLRPKIIPLRNQTLSPAKKVVRVLGPVYLLLTKKE
jgi:hypothetical protein